MIEKPEYVMWFVSPSEQMEWLRNDIRAYKAENAKLMFENAKLKFENSKLTGLLLYAMDALERNGLRIPAEVIQSELGVEAE